MLLKYTSPAGWSHLGNLRYFQRPSGRPGISCLLLLQFLLCSGVLCGANRDLVIADFEGESYGEWTAIGEAMGAKPARGALPGQMSVSGYVGKGLVNSFTGGDKSTGTLTSAEFKHKALVLTNIKREYAMVIRILRFQ